jgi:hypothetical protein
MDVKYPNITVKLIGQDGNAFSILGIVNKALKKNKVSQEEIDLFNKEATNGDYNHLLQIVMKWVSVDGGEDQEDENICDNCGESYSICDCDDYCSECCETLDDCTCDEDEE